MSGVLARHAVSAKQAKKRHAKPKHKKKPSRSLELNRPRVQGARWVRARQERAKRRWQRQAANRLGGDVSEDADRGRARPERRAPRATATSSSSTATTSPTGRSSRCRRSSRRPRASRPAPSSASRTCSSSCSRTTGRRASRSRGTRGPSTATAEAEAAEVVYKEGRRPMPDLLREQFPHFRPIVEAFGYSNLEFEGWEADDVIATLATRADAVGGADVRRLDRPRRVPARLGERQPDDDAARRQRRTGLHAGAGRGALRDPARRGSRTSSASRATPRTTSRASRGSATRPRGS